MTTTDQGGPLTPRESHVRKSGQNGSCTASRHGTRVAYDTYGCRCPEARAASSRARARRAARAYLQGPNRIDATGTVRRLRALAVIGWDVYTLADRLSWDWHRVSRIRTGAQQMVLRDTARAIAAIYDELAARRGPSARAALDARQRGWQPPLAWDDDTIDDPTAEPNVSCPVDIDEIAVERAIAGGRVRLTRTERDHVIRVLAAAGHDDAEIARRLHMNHSAVGQYRKRHGIAPGVPPNRNTDQEVAS